MRKFFNKMIEGRQRSANRQVARLLKNYEFRNESYDYILSRVEEGKINELY